MPQEQFQRVKQNQNPIPESSQEDRDDTVTACTRMTTQQPEIKKAMEMQPEAEHCRSDGDLQSEINLGTKSNQIATVLNCIHQFKIQAHRLNRSRSAQENKHVSDGVYKHPVENKCDLEAKDFSKPEAELVDVKDTLQTLFQTLRKRWPRTIRSCRRTSTRGTRTTPR